MAWYNLSNVTNRLFGAWMQSTANTTANSESSSSSSTSTVVAIPPVVNSTLQYLQESTVVVAEQGFTIIGGAFVQGFGLLFERLNPMLESFVNGLLDAQVAAGPPRSRAAQRRLAAAAMANPALERDLEQQERPDYSTLPPAPPASRAPLSARGAPTNTPRGGVRPSPRIGNAAGPIHTLPTAPPPLSRSRQGTPRMSAAPEAPLHLPVYDVLKSTPECTGTASPTSDNLSRNIADSVARYDHSTSLVSSAGIDEAVVSVDAIIAVESSTREDDVLEVAEPQLQSVALPEEVDTDSVSVTPVTQQQGLDIVDHNQCVSPTEEIQEHLLNLALASEEDGGTLRQEEFIGTIEATSTNAATPQPESVNMLTQVEGSALDSEKANVPSLPKPTQLEDVSAEASGDDGTAKPSNSENLSSMTGSKPTEVST